MIVTVDIIPFRLSGCADKGLEVLLIKRSNPNRPYHGVWALPGGFVFDKDLTSEGDVRQMKTLKRRATHLPREDSYLSSSLQRSVYRR